MHYIWKWVVTLDDQELYYIAIKNAYSDCERIYFEDTISLWGKREKERKCGFNL